MDSLVSFMISASFSMEDSTSTNLSNSPSPKSATEGWQLSQIKTINMSFTGSNKWTSTDDNEKNHLLLKQKQKNEVRKQQENADYYAGMLALANDRMKAYQTEMQQSEVSKQLLYLVSFSIGKNNQYKNIIYN